MGILPPPSSSPKKYYANDLIVDACIEIGIVAPDDVDNLSGDVAQWAFRKLNDVLDVWAAQKCFVYATVFSVFPLIPNHAPTTIGPTGDWVVAQRPVKIMSAALLLNSSTTEVDCPINIRDNAWWAGQQTKSITSSVPTDLYYEAAWENGECNLWPVPSTARNVRIESWVQLAQFDSITNEISGPGTSEGTLPPAYRTALKLTLAETLCPGAKVTASPELVGSAKIARRALFGNNNLPARIATQDYGMPRTGHKGGYFNWGTGGPPGMGPR